jgi:hypothetical protein
VKSVKRYHNPPSKKKIKLRIPRLVNWANQIANNSDMQHGFSMHVNPLDEYMFPRLKFNQEELEAIVDKTKEGLKVADIILRSELFGKEIFIY